MLRLISARICFHERGGSCRGKLPETGSRGSEWTDFLRGFELELKRWDFCQFGLELTERQTEIEQRGNEHVATDSADEISVGYSACLAMGLGCSTSTNLRIEDGG